MGTSIVVINVLLIIGILVFVVLPAFAPPQRAPPQPYGSPFPPTSAYAMYERFEVKGPEIKGDGFTSNERELFEDLKNKKLSNDDIKRLIKEGVLTEVLINKFLKKLDFPGLLQPKQKAKNVDTVEAFSCETSYVGVTKNWDAVPRWWDGSPVGVADPDADPATDPEADQGAKVRGRCGKR
jgi:hypothetical protein